MIVTIPEGEVIDLWAYLDNIYQAGIGVSLTHRQLERLLEERASLIKEKNAAVSRHWQDDLIY